MSATRVRAIFRKELRDYRRNRQIVVSMAVLPLVFSVYPVIEIFALPTSSAGALAGREPLIYMPAVASAVVRAPEVLAQLLFTPLVTAFAIWAGIAISARSSDPRVATQLSVLASLPIVAVTTLISAGGIHGTLRLALILGAALLLADGLGWRVVSAMFDRERLITGTRT